MILKNTSLFLIVGLGLLCASCKTYYYATVQSHEKELSSDENGSFHTSSNNLSVTYSFKDLGGNLVYEIHNESDDPVVVDWSRSVIIAEDYAVQLKDNNARFHGNVSTTTYHFSNSDYTTSSGTVSGRVLLPQSDLFVPPHTKVVHSPMSLSKVLDLNIPPHMYQEQYMGLSLVRTAEFTPENTPLKFKSYLTIVNDRDKSQTVFEDVFFISEIIKTKSSNSRLSDDLMWRNDKFCIEVVNRNAVIATALVGTAALAVGTYFLLKDMPPPSTSY